MLRCNFKNYVALKPDVSGCRPELIARYFMRWNQPPRLETDLWQQYTELGGVTHETQNPYQLAFQNLDSDGSQYITSNTLDELSHADFLNAYLISKGEEPVDLDEFRTLPSSTADGAEQIGRLTNLTKLDCGPMSGFDANKVNAEFFADGKWKANLICNLGYRDADKLFPRNPRLEFEEAASIL